MQESECRLWAIKDPLLTEYHDHEWCHISHDDRYIFEMLCLEGQSVGLSWRTIINKRKAYQEAFFDFDIDKCASLTDDYLYSLLENAELIRNKSKIFSVRKNAIVAKRIIEQYGSLDQYVWAYTEGKQIVGHWKTSADMPTETEISRKLSKDLKKLGMAFVGPVITYSFMQSIGMVNDHLLDCRYRWSDMKTERLILRRWEDSDAEDLYKYACDPDVGPIAGWPAHQSVEESLGVIRNVLNAEEAYAICLKEDNKAIGAIELKLNGHTDMTDRDDECEMGFWIGKPFWGQGMMPEAVREMLRHAFEDCGMEKVWIGYYEGNDKSKRVQEKCGFKYLWKSENIDVPLMHEKRTGHVSVMTKEDWLWNIGK